MINLPSRTRRKDPTHCNLCKDELNKENTRIYQGYKGLRCKKRLSKISREHNAKRQKILKSTKLW